MNDDRRFLGLLSDVLAAPPRIAPDGLLDAVVEDVRVTGQRVRRRPTVHGSGQRRRSSTWRLAIAATLACVIGSVLVIGLTPLAGIVLPQPTPTQTPSASPAPSPSRTPSAATDIHALTHLEPDVTYTSARFVTGLTFKVHPRNPGTTGDEWCMPPVVTTRSIVFQHAMSCREGVGFLRPYEVSCGIPEAHPNADALAAAILANPAMAGAVDVGTLQTPGALPNGMFAAEYRGRVVEIPARFAPYAGGEPCVLFDEPGSRAPLLEVTGDVSMRLVLVDVDGGLLVIRAWGDGTGGVTEFMHLLSVTYDIKID